MDIIKMIMRLLEASLLMTTSEIKDMDLMLWVKYLNS